mgnify:CR=1 FL=1
MWWLFAGYFVYSNQEFLIGAYKENRKLPSINEERVEDAAGMLFKQTPATVVAVFKVNPLFGSRVLHRAYTREGRDKSVEGIDVGLFTSNAANNHDVIKLMANETPYVANTSNHNPKSACGTRHKALPSLAEHQSHQSYPGSLDKLPLGSKVNLKT